MRRRYIYFLLTYFHNSSKKEHITKYSIKSTINSQSARPVVCPVSSAATPTGHFLSGPSSDPSARHVLVRPRVVSPGKRAVKRVCVCVFIMHIMFIVLILPAYEWLPPLAADV